MSNTPYNPATSAHQGNDFVQRARSLCLELGDAMHEENTMLHSRKLEKLDDVLMRKKRLAAKLEKALADIKTNREVVKADSRSAATTQLLEQEMQAFQTLARKNLIMLQAAHQMRGDFLDMVRKAITEKQAINKGYTKAGQSNVPSSNVPLINKQI